VPKRMPRHGVAIGADRMGEHFPRNRPKFECESCLARSAGLLLRRRHRGSLDETAPPGVVQQRVYSDVTWLRLVVGGSPS